jgi:hypothetical protein
MNVSVSYNGQKIISVCYGLFNQIVCMCVNGLMAKKYVCDIVDIC